LSGVNTMKMLSVYLVYFTVGGIFLLSFVDVIFWAAGIRPDFKPAYGALAGLLIALLRQREKKGDKK